MSNVRSGDPAPSLGEILQKAGKRALGGGLAGAGAMVIQVTSLMWMRTTMNYQYRHGTTTKEAMRALYSQGGVPRFYAGIAPALLQGPLSRFGDTAANAGVLALLNNWDSTRDLPIMAKTLVASNAAAAWRIILMPIDTCKTIMQVEGGKQGLTKLRAKVSAAGGGLASARVFYHGSVGAYSATFVGHYPWFATYNTLDANIPVPTELLPKLARNAGMGFCSSVISDCCSNSIRVLKTYRQTSEVQISYQDAARKIIAQDGVAGLMGRGLKTRILANGAQGIMFSVMWKFFDEKLQKRM